MGIISTISVNGSLWLPEIRHTWIVFKWKNTEDLKVAKIKRWLDCRAAFTKKQVMKLDIVINIDLFYNKVTTIGAPQAVHIHKHFIYVILLTCSINACGFDGFVQYFCGSLLCFC